MTHAYDPELAPWAPAFAEPSFADIPALGAGEAELIAALPPYDPPGPLDVDELLVPGPDGAPEVRVRRYRPADHDGPLPALVYIHGGGFVVGSLDLYDADCRRIAAVIEVG
jgi:acetyl esterase